MDLSVCFVYFSGVTMGGRWRHCDSPDGGASLQGAVFGTVSFFINLWTQ